MSPSGCLPSNFDLIFYFLKMNFNFIKNIFGSLRALKSQIARQKNFGNQLGNKKYNKYHSYTNYRSRVTKMEEFY